MKREPLYTLDDFGRPEYKDPIVPVNMLMVMMGFALLLFNDAIGHIANIIDFSSYFFGTIFLLGFMLYVADYHEKLWENYFSLPTDRMFFRLYGIFVGITVISLMHVYPNYWYVYVLVLFVLMYFKKRSTMKHFEDAFYDKFSKVVDCDCGHEKSRLYLSQAFTTNFLYAGVFLSIVFGVALQAAKIYVVDADKVIADSIFDYILNPYFWICALYTLIFVSFWMWKIKSHLIRMATALKNGNAEFFEQLKFGS